MERKDSSLCRGLFLEGGCSRVALVQYSEEMSPVDSIRHVPLFTGKGRQHGAKLLAFLQVASHLITHLAVTLVTGESSHRTSIDE